MNDDKRKTARQGDMHLVRQSASAGEQADVRAMRAETERKRKKRAEDVGALHLCKQCGGPLRDAEGKIPMYETKDGLREYTICEKCRKRAREYEKKRRK